MDKKWPRIGIVALSALIGLALAFGSATELVLYEGEADAAAKPLRLHVLANSDSPADQRQKLAVRDFVVAYLADDLAAAPSRAAAVALLRARADELEQAVNDYLGADAPYRASVSLSCEEFPEIDYDGVVFAAGEYQALRVILGEGAGHNWWCVLFPPLCFVDIAGEYPAADAVAVMSEYDALDVGQSKLRVEWKLASLWQEL